MNTDALQDPTPLALTLTLSSFWRCGTGEPRGLLDDQCCRDSRLGLPIVPGRQLKGLLKDALDQADDFGWFSTVPDKPESVAKYLFGLDGEEGKLRVDNARLSDAEYQYFAANQKQINRLFRQSSAIAISHELQVTEQGALRTVEMAVPMTLQALVRPVNAEKLNGLNWQSLITESLPLIRSLGADRARGLGRVQITKTPASVREVAA